MDSTGLEPRRGRSRNAGWARARVASLFALSIGIPLGFYCTHGTTRSLEQVLAVTGIVAAVFWVIGFVWPGAGWSFLEGGLSGVSLTSTDERSARGPEHAEATAQDRP